MRQKIGEQETSSTPKIQIQHHTVITFRYMGWTSVISQNKDIQKCIFLLKVRKGFFQSAMFLASALKRGSHPPENILKM